MVVITCRGAAVSRRIVAIPTPISYSYGVESLVITRQIALYYALGVIVAALVFRFVRYWRRRRSQDESIF